MQKGVVMLRYEDIKVRADFAQGQVVPLCFQLSPESSFCNIKRILNTTEKREEQAVDFKCTFSVGHSSVESKILLRFDYADVLHWSAMMMP